MQKTLHDLYMENKYDLRDSITNEDTVVFNGRYFSDSEFFSKGKEYSIVDVEDCGLHLIGNQSIELFIFPDGLGSFNKKGGITMETKYMVDVMYDNGKVVSYSTGSATETNVEDMLNVIADAYRDDKPAYIQFPNEDGLSVIIDVKKTSSINFRITKS